MNRISDKPKAVIIIFLLLFVATYSTITKDNNYESDLYFDCRVPETTTSKIAYLNTSSGGVFTGEELTEFENLFELDSATFVNNSGQYQWRGLNGTGTVYLSITGDRSCVAYLNPNRVSYYYHDLPSVDEDYNLSLKYIQKIRGRTDDLYCTKAEYNIIYHLQRDRPTEELKEYVSIVFRQKINNLPVLGRKGQILVRIGANGSLASYHQLTLPDIVHQEITHHHDPVNKTDYTTGKKENVSIISGMDAHQKVKAYRKNASEYSRIRAATRVSNLTLCYYVDSFFNCPSRLDPIWRFKLSEKSHGTEDKYAYQILVNAVTGELIPPQR